MNCPQCDSYNRGKGMPDCLSCPQYQDIVRRSFRRHSVKEEHLPQNVLEQIAEDAPPIEIQALIGQLPDDLGDLLILRYYGRRTQDQIAAVMRMSRARVGRKIREALDMLRVEIEQ